LYTALPILSAAALSAAALSAAALSAAALSAAALSAAAFAAFKRWPLAKIKALTLDSRLDLAGPSAGVSLRPSVTKAASGFAARRAFATATDEP
jgi:hypothetical protein